MLCPCLTLHANKVFSQGTRLHIYRWNDNDVARAHGEPKDLQSLPAIETKKKWTEKTHPGVSTFVDKPNQVGHDHLEGLFKTARKYIPDDAAEDTPFFLLATAGMRLLPVIQRNVLLHEICSYTKSHTKFKIPDCDAHIRVISGDTEGLYGWIAANYLLGGFDAPIDHALGKNHDTFGFLDMGGASAQIAFAPNATEAERHANDLTMVRMRTVDGVDAEYKVFTTTWLGFGANEARKRYVEALQKESGSINTKVLQDPCLPPGLSISTKGDVLLPGSKTINGKEPILNGTGQFDKCLQKTLPLLEKDHICEDDPCLLGGVHVPAIDFDINHFVGVSEYWHSTHEIFQLGEKDKAYDYNTYQQRVSKFCSRDWDEIEEGIKTHEFGEKVDEQRAVEACFKASWLISILHEGIGFPRVGLEAIPDSKHNGTKKLLDGAKDQGFTPSFKAVNKIDDTEVSWTLGKIILYASSQITPSAKSTLPVGFGSNFPGIPPDFQYAAPIHSQTAPNQTMSSETTTKDYWHTAVLRTATPRRIPGIILFIAILGLAVFILCGRSRRERFYGRFSNPQHRSNGLSPRKRNFFSGKVPSIFRSNPAQGNYERVIEDGYADHFELGSLDEESSDSSTSSHASKTSGWATPRNGAAQGATFENLGSGQGLGIGLGGSNAMERSGLIGRVDSRERLSAIVEGKKSRRASPSRPKGLSLSPLAED